ncbi:MAG TPA: response regulator [Campylobacterales bacterium]|nr:response regulator [Campylobacterales bacterium]
MAKSIEELKQWTNNLSLLFVDDAEDIRDMYHFFFDKVFKKVYEASDGNEALQIFKENRTDINLIITDQSMPKMSGIEMIRHIREIDKKIPIILVTATKEHNDLIDAINLNVTNFIEKPIKYENIVEAIENAIQKVIVEDLIQKNREQELEILKYKNAYADFQQNEAFKKQLNIIQNDLYKRRIDIDDGYFILIDHYYKPKDILSGDTYSIHSFEKNGRKKLFFFIIDAMGKGISASVSTLISASFINYYFERNKENFDFRKTIEKYIDFVQFELLEEEIISAVFGIFDIKNDAMEIANFSMPPVLGVTKSGEVKKLSTTNLPINTYNDEFVINRIDTSDITKVMLYSDGLTENTTKDEMQYLKYIQEDFMNSTSKNEFMKLFLDRVKEQEDDTTILYFEKMDLRNNLLKTFTYSSTMESIDKALEDFGKILNEFELDLIQKMKLESSFNELIMNAYEHGNLNINASKKQQLMENGEYMEYLRNAEKEFQNRNIVVKYYLVDGVLVVNIEDEGKGFDTNILKILLDEDTERFHGRGILMSDNDFDFIMYNEVGNSVLFGKKVL